MPSFVNDADRLPDIAALKTGHRQLNANVSSLQQQNCSCSRTHYGLRSRLRVALWPRGSVLEGLRHRSHILRPDEAYRNIKRETLLLTSAVEPNPQSMNSPWLHRLHFQCRNIGLRIHITQ